MSQSLASREVIEVLKVDPDLGNGIAESARGQAVRSCVARVVRATTGDWSPPPGSDDRGGFGLLMLSGFVARRIGNQPGTAAELIGPGDLIRPSLTLMDQGDLGLESSWAVVSDARLGVLDARFAYRAAAYPEIAGNLTERALTRSRLLVTQAMIARQRPVEERLRMIFAHLAERWGRVHPDGIHLDLPLTHSLIADLVATRRPTVTSGLGALAARGLVARTADGWLIASDQPLLHSSNGEDPSEHGIVGTSAA